MTVVFFCNDTATTEIYTILFVGSVGSAYSGVLSALCARARRSAVRIHTAARRRRPAARRGRRARDAAARLAASRGAAPLSGKPADQAVHGRPPYRHRRAASTLHEPRRAHLHPPTASLVRRVAAPR